MHPLVTRGKNPQRDEPVLISKHDALLIILFELGCDIDRVDVKLFDQMLGDLGYEILPLPQQVT